MAGVSPITPENDPLDMLRNPTAGDEHIDAAEARRALERESALEAALHEGRWNSELSGQPTPLLGDEQWDRLVEETILESGSLRHTANRSPFTNPRRSLLAAAAAVALMIGIWYGLGILPITPVRKQHTFDSRLSSGSQQTKTDTSIDHAGDHQPHPVQEPLSASKRIVARDHLADPLVPHIPDDRKSYIRLADSTGLLAQRGSRVRVQERTDSTIALLMAEGNCIFSVKKNGFHRFGVLTPHASITVTGTVFRVLVTELETEVTVYEGAVVFTPREGGAAGDTLYAGAAAVADIASPGTALLDSSRMLKTRRSLLRDYLEWLNTESLGEEMHTR
jgi:hypothetical protein